MIAMLMDAVESIAVLMLYGAGMFSAPIRRWTLRRL